MSDSTDTKLTSTVSLRLPIELRKQIRVMAAEEDKSANQWMVEALALVVRRTLERRDA